MIHDAGLSARTKMTGFVEGLAKADLFETSDIFVLPSHQENFGIAVVEAMTFGVPVIVSNNIDIHDEIAKARAGLIVSTAVEDLCAAIRKLANDPLLRFEMSERAKDLVQRKFCGAVNALETLRVYRDIIQNSRESSAWKSLPKPLVV